MISHERACTLSSIAKSETGAGVDVGRGVLDGRGVDVDLLAAVGVGAVVGDAGMSVLVRVEVGEGGTVVG
jgi:hypothetical protein